MLLVSSVELLENELNESILLREDFARLAHHALRFNYKLIHLFVRFLDDITRYQIERIDTIRKYPLIQQE